MYKLGTFTNKSGTPTTCIVCWDFNIDVVRVVRHKHVVKYVVSYTLRFMDVICDIKCIRSRNSAENQFPPGTSLCVLLNEQETLLLNSVCCVLIVQRGMSAFSTDNVSVDRQEDKYFCSRRMRRVLFHNLVPISYTCCGFVPVT